MATSRVPACLSLRKKTNKSGYVRASVYVFVIASARSLGSALVRLFRAFVSGGVYRRRLVGHVLFSLLALLFESFFFFMRHAVCGQCMRHACVMLVSLQIPTILPSQQKVGEIE